MDELIPAKDLVRPKRLRRKRTLPRKRTLAIKRISRDDREAGWRALDVTREDAEVELALERPRTWAQCRNRQDLPCAFVGCKHHLYLDVNEETGSITINRPDLEPWELMDPCSLKIASRRGHTLDEVGAHLNITRERVRQIEVRVMIRKLRGAARVRALGVDGPLG